MSDEHIINDPDVFITRTDADFSRKVTIRSASKIFLILTAAACLGLFAGIALFGFLELILLFSCVYAVKKNDLNHEWKLTFEGNFLTVCNLSTYDTYEIYDIPASDFVITQSKKEKELDYCEMMVKNTIFKFYGIKNYSQMKTHIDKYYN